MKQMIKLGLILALYTSIACVTLAFVNDLTKDTIASAKDKELNEGLKIVFAKQTHSRSSIQLSFHRLMMLASMRFILQKRMM